MTDDSTALYVNSRSLYEDRRSSIKIIIVFGPSKPDNDHIRTVGNPTGIMIVN